MDLSMTTRTEPRALVQLLRSTAAHYRQHGPEPVQHGPDEGDTFVGITPAEWEQTLKRAEALATRIERVNNPVHAEACAEAAFRLLSTLAHIPSGR